VKSLQRMGHNTPVITVALWALAAAVLFPIRVAGAAAAPDSPPKTLPAKEPAQPAYWRDPRLEKEVRFPEEKRGSRRKPRLGRIEPEFTEGPLRVDARPGRLVEGRVLAGSTLVRMLQEQTGVPLLLRGDWMREPFAVPLAAGPARELMDDLARVFNASWFQQGEIWVLARSQTEARWTAMPREERATQITANMRTLFTSFTPEQWDKLARTERAPLYAFPPPQGRPVMESIRLYYYNPELDAESVPTRPATRGEGLFLRLAGAGKTAALVLEAPGPAGPRGFTATFSFYDRETGQLLWGVPPPR